MTFQIDAKNHLGGVAHKNPNEALEVKPGMDMIQVHTTSEISLGYIEELLWAIKISDDTAVLANIPWFSNKFSLEDIVKFDPLTKEMVATIEKRSNAILCRTAIKGEIKWHAIIDFLWSQGLLTTEYLGNGVFSAAFSIDIPISSIPNIISNCPFPITLEEAFPIDAMPPTCATCGVKMLPRTDN